MHALIVALGVIKIRQLNARLTALSKRLRNHENEIEMEGAESENPREITVNTGK